MRRCPALLISLFLLLIGCTTPEKRADLPAGLALLLDGKTEQAHAVFQERCQEGVETSCAFSGSTWSSPKLLPVLQGFSNTDWARLNVFPDKGSRVHYFYRPAGPFALKPLRAHSPRASGTSQLRVDRLSIAVQPGVTYELLAVSEEGELLDRRRFSGLKLVAGGKKFALLSCTDDAFSQSDQKLMWDRVHEQSPDVILMIGDNIYATTLAGQHVAQISPEQLWSRYEDMVSAFDVYRWEKLVPVWAIWDDHDYGMKDGDITYPHRDEARDIFLSFFPQEAGLKGYDRGPGISYRVQLEELDLYFFDNRTFRQADASAEHGHFGAQQNTWFQDLIGQQRRAAWLVSGDQFFGGYHPFESFEGSHPAAFEGFVNFLKQVPAPVAFLSGDRHHFELIKVPPSYLGYSTYEVTSSALYARTYPDSFKRFPSPNMVVGFAGRLNFAVLDEVQVQRGKMNFKVTAYSKEKKPLTQKSLSVERK